MGLPFPSAWSEKSVDEEKDQPGSVDTGGGAGIEGNVELTGGDFIGRDKAVQGDEVRGDKYVQINQLDIGKLVQTLRETLPTDDDTPLALVQTLRSFQVFHSRLFEWKELHNFLNDISFSMSQLSREVERIEAQGSPVNRRMLARLWRPIGNLVLAMLEWAATVEYIAEQPFSEMSGGSPARPGLWRPRWPADAWKRCSAATVWRSRPCMTGPLIL